MPNHIKNIVKPDKRFEEIAEKVKSAESAFDFNMLKPMPKELKNTRSPSWIVSDESYESEVVKIKSKNGTHDGTLPLSQSMSDDYKRRFGADNWYDWACANWQTKWGAYDVLVDGGAFEYETAWSHSFVIIDILSRLFPDVTFSVKYADEDIGNNCGSYDIKNGEVEEKDIEDDRQFAYEVWGYSEEDIEEIEKDSE